MKRKTILKEASVLLITAVLFFSSTLVMANTNNQTADNISNLNSTMKKTFEPGKVGRGTLGTVIFSQPPYGPNEWVTAYTSSSQPGYGWLCQEDFWNLSVSIDDVEWWGFQAIYSAGWIPGDPTGAVFEIKFYQDVGGAPGSVVKVFSNLTPAIVDLGYWNWVSNLYYFSVNLPEKVNLATGWISIDNTFTPDSSAMLWIDSSVGNLNALQNSVNLGINLAFNLTHTPEANLDCDGDLSWDDIKPGSTVTGNFGVGNIGEIGSLLNWKVDSWPTWGTWTFSPPSGTGLLDGTWVPVTVTVVAPAEKNKEFSGNVTVINVDDPSDYCIVPVYLKTPLNYNHYFQQFFEWLFEQFPNAFPRLRQLMGY
jgi:hypothetical protein